MNYKHGLSSHLKQILEKYRTQHALYIYIHVSSDMFLGVGQCGEESIARVNNVQWRVRIGAALWRHGSQVGMST